MEPHMIDSEIYSLVLVFGSIMWVS